MSTSTRPTQALNKVWLQASDQAAALSLPERLWQRPQVQGVTIDGPTSKDLDDAIYLEATPTGAIAAIHIADVSELVTAGTVLDKVAIARTCTHYLSRGNLPMLPPALSEDKLSLLEGQPRPTLTIQVSLNHQAEIQTTEIYESWIVSAKRFSYEGVFALTLKKV
ncbi:RNB-like protein [Synechococcus sp. PCC 7335]|uniref:ribonuclease catalytic domain-containing protein n=1 Tax=Synechococcus sp. (strain ATCC 29403 / PCC 7335) TaxID=91464 RepID=UPI00017EC83A|nr:ribonuclease catalytic domain-containing protein [Synechococcus sp. PCC 7335]EDX82329.1 RNB-like protein [Synechococcus sp. PCC 7335]